MGYIERLLEERAKAWHAAKEILDRAAEEGRGLSAAEEESYAKATKEIDELRSQADKLYADQESARKAEETLRSILGSKREEVSEAPKTEDQLRSFMRGEVREMEFKPGTAETAEVRALSKGTATAGGNTVPTTFYGQLWAHLIEVASMLAGGATLLTTNSGETIEVPITTSHGAAAAVAEAGTLAGTDPAFAKRTLGAFKYGELIVLSRELVDDTGVDLEGYLAQVAGWNIGNAFGSKLIAGAGTTEPTGITASTTLGVTGGTGVVGAPTLDNLIDLFYSVTAPYRNRPAASWLVKDQTAGVLRKIKDTTNNYIWQPSVVAGTPDSLLSKPILTDPYMPAVGLNNKSVIFGDLSSYMVRVVNGVRFERSNEYGFASDQIAFRAIIRGDGLLIDQTGAVKHYVGAAS